MKLARKFFSLLMVVGILLSFTITSFAAERSFTINNVTVSASSGKYVNNCSAYAGEILSKIWHYKGTTTTFSSQYNMLRGLSATERAITVDHVRAFIQNAPLGSRIRICSSPSNTENNYDKSQYGHTMVLVDKNDVAGTFTTLEAGFGAAETRDYTYESFTSKWTNYIKNGIPSTGYNYFFYIADLTYFRTSDVSLTTGNPAITLNISSYPTTLDQGDSYPLRGTITSNYNITSVRGSILNSSGREVMGYTQNPNTKSFNIRGSAVDMNLKFGSLSAGSYTLKFTAENSAGTFKSWSRSFTVKGTAAPQTYTVTFDARGGSVSPSSVTLTVGQSYKNFPTPTYPGFEFVGWYIDRPNEYGISTTIVRDIGVFNLTEDATIYAEWREAQPEHVACTTHTKGAFQFYEASHPHYNYYKCSVCGENFTDGTTSYMESCATCNPPKKPATTDWSDWSTTPVQATATRQMETRTVKVSDAKTQYRYGRFVANGHDCWCRTYLESLGYGKASLDYSAWSDTRYSKTGKDWSCGYCRGIHTGVHHTGSDGRDWWTGYRSPSGANYYWEETRTVPAVYETQYRYRDQIN